MSEIESYLEDNRPTLDEVCEEYKECTEKCPAWKFCKVESERIANKNQLLRDTKHNTLLN